MNNTGKTVTIDYVGYLDDGTMFNNTLETGERVTFVCGHGEIIEGVDKAVRDMSVGDKRHVVVPAEEAYGEYNDDYCERFPIDEMGNSKELQVGKTICTMGDNGVEPAIVKEVTDKEVVLDFNHPFAGKDLTFDIMLVEVKDPIKF